MATNLERFTKDLDRLIRQGELLQIAMIRDISGEDAFIKALREKLETDKIESCLKELPNFRDAYDSWYSEALGLLRQLLPDRVSNFISFYEKPRGRKSIDYGNYVIQDYLQGVQVTYLGDITADKTAALPQFQQQLAIVKGAKIRFESSLFEIRQLLQADLFDSEIDAARELLKNKFLRAAGAIAGVVLEKHLHQVCNDHAVKISKRHPGIGDLNELLKAGSIIDTPQWRHISLLGDIRNLCDHNKQKEPTAEQVTDLIDGTNRVLKTIA